VDAGFKPEGIISVSLDLRRPAYAKERLPVVYRDILRSLSTGPGVLSAAQVGFTPVSGSGWNNRVRPNDATGESKDSNFNRVGPGYFRTMGTGLLTGREFDDRDSLAAPKVAIVNEEFMAKIFSGKNPVGHTFRVEGEAGKPDPVYQIVGVVRNTKYHELRESFLPIAFVPMAQDDDTGTGMTYVLRTSGSLRDVFSGVKTEIAAVHPEIGLEFRVLTTQLKDSLMRERLMATLSGAFGVLAGLLATLGLYGVIAYMVARRRNEIGIRIALGADRARVIRLVLREAGLLVVGGLVVGACLALWAGKAAGTLLFGLKPNDPSTIAAAMALLVCVALMASYVPARRAARLDPMQALRED
jgi:predicted permease